MPLHAHSRRWVGWYYPARTTAVFLFVAATCMTLLAVVALSQFRDATEQHASVEIDRAARTAAALFAASDDTFTVDLDPSGTPARLTIDSADQLAPGEAWDGFVDQVSTIHQGAANVFRYDSSTGQFDRIATSFTNPEAEPTGGAPVEAGVISEGHPAFESLTDLEPYVGEVPVAGRQRFASLTPIVDGDLQLAGALAVDIGWADDLDHISDDVNERVWATTFGLLVLLAAGSMVAMFFVFRSMRRLIRFAQELGSGIVPTQPLVTERRGEIGLLASALERVGILQQDLSDRALHDQLTGLPNRAHFQAELQRRMENAQSADDEFALLLIDLDEFKEVNDGLGHAAGDELLMALSDTLRDVLTADEFIARLGGDEFACLTGPVVSEVDVDQIAQRITDAISAVTTTSVAEIGVTSSIGITILPRQAETAELALSHADLALYRAKRDGRAHWQFYQSTLDAPVQRRIHLATELRRALEHDELYLVYQPMVHPVTSSIAGLEALARWDHPTEGLIPPSEFVTAAESAGLINEVGHRVIEMTCAQISTWSARNLIVPTVSVNVSTIQLWQPDFVQRLQKMLAENGLRPSDICLEITESVIVHHADHRSRQILEELSLLGVRLSIDDFGTGYSSLSYLQNLTVDQVKIDRMFLASTTPGSSGEQLFAGIASLARSLGLEVVAEGVETPADLYLARRYGCDLVQGYLLSRELSPDDAAGLLTSSLAASTPAASIPTR